MSEETINSILEDLRKRYLEWSLNSLHTQLAKERFEPIRIVDKTFQPSVWLDKVGNEQLLIVQLEHKGVFSSTAHCCGARLLESGKKENLSNEQLWEMGVP